jgi:plasmid stabilization system protein ParE
MTLYRFTTQASDDLLEIWRYIAADNPEAADRVENAIYDACTLIVQSPLAGQQRKDLTTLPLRFWILARYPSYLIVYDPRSTPLQIIRILHGMQDVKRILQEP